MNRILQALSLPADGNFRAKAARIQLAMGIVSEAQLILDDEGH